MPDKTARRVDPISARSNVGGGILPPINCEANSNSSVGARSESEAASVVTDSALSGSQLSAAPLTGVAAQPAPRSQTGGAQ